LVRPSNPITARTWTATRIASNPDDKYPKRALLQNWSPLNRFNTPLHLSSGEVSGEL
jgi:hypothetical protein